jgi:Flp pilus assembly pilin Flp
MRDEDAVSTVEYALLLALLVLVSAAAWTGLQARSTTVLTNTSSAVAAGPSASS